MTQALSARWRLSILLAMLAVGAAILLLQPLLHGPGPGATLIEEAQFVADESPDPPPEAAPWVPRSLPDHWRKPGGGIDAGWYRASFTVDEKPVSPWGAFIPRASTSYELYVNGTLVGVGSGKTWSVSVPQLELIAPQLLQAGTNILHLRLSVSPDRRGGLTAITLGPQAEVEQLYNREHFARFTLTRSLNTTFIVVGFLVFTLWLVRPSETIYAWFSGLALVWSLRNIQYAMPADTAIFALVERMLLGSLVVIVLLLWAFMRRFTGVPHNRTEAGLFAVGGLVLVVLASISQPAVHAARLPVGLGCAAVAVWTIAMLVRFGFHPQQRQRLGVWVMVAALALSLALSLTDLAIGAQLLPFGPASRTAYSGPLILMAMVFALADNYFNTYDQLRALSAELEQRVQERTAELERTHARVLALERAATLAGERERLMRDMHDGIGSQLIATLDAVERGGLPPEETGALLRGCIDDLRLMIDSLDPQEDSLPNALANLRWRLQPRLQAAGVQVDWQVDEAVTVATPGHVLQVLRVVQEALTNVLKHARASRLRLSVAAAAGGGLQVEVADDGTGLAGPQAAGRGLRNMRARATQLGAQLRIDSAAGQGTRVVLTLEPAGVGAA